MYSAKGMHDWLLENGDVVVPVFLVEEGLVTPVSDRDYGLQMEIAHEERLVGYYNNASELGQLESDIEETQRQVTKSKGTVERILQFYREDAGEHRLPKDKPYPHLVGARAVGS